MDVFRQYDFEADERWKAYMRTVELPAGDTAAAMLKVKARWYKRTIDPDFDTAAAAAAAGPKPFQGTPPAASASGTAGSKSAGNAGDYSSGYARPQAPPPPPPRYGNAGAGTYGGSSAQMRLFLMHLGMLLLGIFVVVPFLPYSRRFYLFFMRLTIVTFGYKIYLQHGLPSFRPLSMIMAWVQRVMPTADFLQLMIAFSFSAQPPMLLVAVPALVLAAYHAAAYAAAHFAGNPLWQRYGSRVHAIMLRRQQDALMLNAFCEVATALLLVVQLLTPARSLLTLLFYSQILKLKLHVPDSATQHRQVWKKIDELTLPYRLRVPVVEQVIQMAVKWFVNVPAAR